ncbi:ethanolamine permease, partial [Rhizobium ruizarguesonis]
PELARPFRAWGYPVVPAIALGLALVALAALIYYNFLIFVIFLARGVVAFGIWRLLSGGITKEAAAST